MIILVGIVFGAVVIVMGFTERCYFCYFCDIFSTVFISMSADQILEYRLYLIQIRIRS